MLNKVVFPKETKSRFPRAMFSREEMEELTKIGPVGMQHWPAAMLHFCCQVRGVSPPALLGASALHFLMASAGIHILGFKPVNQLKPYHNLREPTFIYPTDRSLQGSTTAFIALHDAMLQVDAKHAF